MLVFDVKLRWKPPIGPFLNSVEDGCHPLHAPCWPRRRLSGLDSDLFQDPLIWWICSHIPSLWPSVSKHLRCRSQLSGCPLPVAARGADSTTCTRFLFSFLRSALPVPQATEEKEEAELQGQSLNLSEKQEIKKYRLQSTAGLTQGSSYSGLTLWRSTPPAS